MKAHLILAATLSACSLLFAQVSHAEESSAFVTRNAQIHHATVSSAQGTVVAEHTTEAPSQGS